MNYYSLLRVVFCTAMLFLASAIAHAQPSPPAASNPNVQLNSWGFVDTDWLSDDGHGPFGFTNIINVPDVGDGAVLLLDTTNTTPAYLLYNLVDGGETTNLTCSQGSIYLWFKPNWSSTNQGGTGPGDWANLISMGQEGTNGPWWSWYFSPDGCTVYFSSQTNGGAATNYLVAPVSFTASNWVNLLLTYDATRSAVYTNGTLITNGSGVAYWPGPSTILFSIGSDSNGLHQARGQFDDLATFNYPLDANSASFFYNLYAVVYYASGGGGSMPLLVQAPSTNTTISTNFYAVSGMGFLSNCSTFVTNVPFNTNIYLTNWAATNIIGTNVTDIYFGILGGTNDGPYDVYATTNFQVPITNATWFWMGQGYRSNDYVLPVTNIPPQGLYLMLGKMDDFDHDGLTDAYERLVSHTNPNLADTDGDGIPDGWEFLLGLDPLINDNATSTTRANYTYDVTDWLTGLTGIKTGTVSLDNEGNVLSVSQ